MRHAFIRVMAYCERNPIVPAATAITLALFAETLVELIAG